MKVLVLYRLNSEHRRSIEEFVDNLRKDGSIKVETLNIDTREGISIASLYDITSYPAIMVLRDDGAVQHLWLGSTIPLIDEVKSYIS